MQTEAAAITKIEGAVIPIIVAWRIRGHEAIARAIDAETGAEFGYVALADGLAAWGGVGCNVVTWTLGIEASAKLGHIANAFRCPTLQAFRLELILRAVGRIAGAKLRQVAESGRSAAFERRVVIVGPARTEAVANVRPVARSIHGLIATGRAPRRVGVDAPTGRTARVNGAIVLIVAHGVVGNIGTAGNRIAFINGAIDAVVTVVNRILAAEYGVTGIIGTGIAIAASERCVDATHERVAYVGRTDVVIHATIGERSIDAEALGAADIEGAGDAIITLRRRGATFHTELNYQIVEICVRTAFKQQQPHTDIRGYTRCAGDEISHHVV